MTCLLPPPPPHTHSLTCIRIKECCRGVCVLYTKTHSPQSPSGALHVNNPNYTGTTRDSCFYYRTAPLCRQQGICSAAGLNTEIKLHREAGERERGKRGEECGVERMKSLGCSQWWCLYSQLPPPLFDLVELFTCRSRRSMLVGRRPTRRSGSNSRQQQITQRGDASPTNSGALFIHLLYLGNVTGWNAALMCCLNAHSKREKASGFTKCHTVSLSQREQVTQHLR